MSHSVCIRESVHTFNLVATVILVSPPPSVFPRAVLPIPALQLLGTPTAEPTQGMSSSAAMVTSSWFDSAGLESTALDPRLL